MPRLSLLCGLVAALVLGLAPNALAAKRTVPQGFFGTAFDGAAFDQGSEVQAKHFKLMATSGVESVRLLASWARMQPTKQGGISYLLTDTTMREAALRGQSVVVTALYTPYWARQYKRRALSPPKKTSDYTKFVRALVVRYGRNGQFWKVNPGIKRPDVQWQIWNEPNLRSYWDAPPKTSYGWPQGYGRLLRASNAAIKRADPKAKTVFAGLTGIAWLEMRRAYLRGGVKGHFDTAALQVYTQSAGHELEAAQRLRAELVRAKDSRRNMFITEVAFPASRGKVRAINKQRQETPASMASQLTKMYTELAKERKALKLDRVFWFTWASRYGRSKSNFDFSGLVHSPDGVKIRPQPALDAYRRTAGRLHGCAKTAFGVCAR